MLLAVALAEAAAEGEVEAAAASNVAASFWDVEAFFSALVGVTSEAPFLVLVFGFFGCFFFTCTFSRLFACSL